MFSRSEKTEEVTEAMAEPSGERSPMVLAALAGLLAIAGAFLLVWYLSNGDDGAVAQGVGVDGEPVAAGAVGSSETDRQVLVVTQAIPKGTSVRALIDAPTVYLSARAVPEQFVAASAITSVAELTELTGLILESEALPGEQLLRGRFRDPNDFAGGESTFLEDATDLDIPAGHHAIVVELPASRALGGLLRKGELVTVIANMRISPPDIESQEVSLVVLNAVEVLNVDSSLEIAGQVSQDFDSVGTASRGSFTVTLAVEPTELTDLTYAISYGEIMLATALRGATNTKINDDGEEVPADRAVTGQRQIAGDDGIWLDQQDQESNVVGLVDLFPPASEEATSIEVELPSVDDEALDERAPEEDADEADPDTEDDADLGDS